jgi:hypothetical protein
MTAEGGLRRALRRCAFAALLGLAAGGAAAQAPPAAAQPEIDLKLFESGEVDRSKGCSVALWQPNRDPSRDKYAYLLIEHLTGPNHARQPARIKVGGQALTMTRVATGGRTNGYGLFEHQLYKIQGTDDLVVIELKLGPLEGEAVAIESGMMSVVMKGRQVFRAPVKGGAGCATPPAPEPPPRRADAPGGQTTVAATVQTPGKTTQATGQTPGPAMFDRYAVRPNLVPREIVAAAQKRFDCDPDMLKTDAVGYALSEESAIWELGCQRFAYQASSVYLLVNAQSPGQQFRFLEFKPPRGKKRSTDAAVLLNPEWDIRSRTVTSISLGRNEGDCGTLERHRVTETGDFLLVEYREKPRCDGKAGKPQTWPLLPLQ